MRLALLSLCILSLTACGPFAFGDPPPDDTSPGDPTAAPDMSPEPDAMPDAAVDPPDVTPPAPGPDCACSEEGFVLEPGCALRCETFLAAPEPQGVDIFFVLDPSGSMHDDYARLESQLASIAGLVGTLGLDARFAVTTLDPDSDGKPLSGWYSDAMSLQADLTRVRSDFQTGRELGLRAGKLGLEYILDPASPAADRARSDARLITVFVSDEEDNEVQDLPQPCDANGCPPSIESNYVDFFRGKTTAIALVTTDDTCNFGVAYSYMRVAEATGGVSLSLCEPLDQGVAQVLQAAASLQGSPYRLAGNPDPERMRVHVDGVQVPRAAPGGDGWRYVAERQSVTFEGSAKPADGARVTVVHLDCPAIDLGPMPEPLGVCDTPSPNHEQCEDFGPAGTKPMADLYFVMDPSGSMVDDYAQMKQSLPSILQSLGSAHVDLRFAVTMMDPSSQGRPLSGWYTDVATLSGDIDTVIAGPSGSIVGQEFGLRAAKAGLEYMTGAAAGADATRQGAEVITLFVSDEEDSEVEETTAGCTAQMCPSAIESTYIDYFRSTTTVLSLVSTMASCSEVGHAYMRAAGATGGQVRSVCDPMGQGLDELLFVAAAAASPFTLTGTPDPTKLEVYVDGRQVPASRTDGYAWEPGSNAIVFFGSWAPQSGQDVSVRY